MERHYCRICDEHKANGKFSEKGHACHICKGCVKRSIAKKKERQRINRIIDFGTEKF